MITEDYCSTEVVELLKKKGAFDDIDLCWKYKDNCTKVYRISHHMARKWLREIKNVYTDVLLVPFSEGGVQWMFCWYQPSVDDVIHSDFSEYSTYEEAVEAALMYCLTNLI